MSRTILSPVLLALVAGATACGGSDKPAPTTTTAGAQGNPAAGASPRDTCVAMFERQRACTDIYLPALVDARIDNDLPAGIAARAAEPGGRDELVSLAQTEWANDSTDASIAATCDDVLAKLPPEQVDGLTAQAGQCLAAADCQAFVDCVIPMTVAMWQSAPSP